MKEEEFISRFIIEMKRFWKSAGFNFPNDVFYDAARCTWIEHQLTKMNLEEDILEVTPEEWAFFKADIDLWMNNMLGIKAEYLKSTKNERKASGLSGKSNTWRW